MHTAAVILGFLLALTFGSLTIANIASNRWLRSFGWRSIGGKVFLVVYLAVTALGVFLIYWGLT